MRWGLLVAAVAVLRPVGALIAPQSTRAPVVPRATVEPSAPGVAPSTTTAASGDDAPIVVDAVVASVEAPTSTTEAVLVDAPGAGDASAPDDAGSPAPGDRSSASSEAKAAPAPSTTAADAKTTTTPPQEKTTPRQGGTLRVKRYAHLEDSVLFPQLARPAVLDGTHAGDLGFDPLGLAPTKEDLYAMMESEVRHARLAMLCAAGWPLSELKAPDCFFDGALLAPGGRAPSVLNGHFFDSPATLAAVALFFAAVARHELYVLRTPKRATLYGHRHALDYDEIADEWPWGVAGDQGFDPLGLYGLVGHDAVGRKVLRDLELSHGRVAMLAVLGYVLAELATGRPVVDLTPWLFGKLF